MELSRKAGRPLATSSLSGRGSDRLALAVALGCVLSVIGGCRSAGFANPLAGLTGPTAPVVLTPTAGSAEVIAAVNANASRIQTYQAPSASISLPESIGLPLIQASLAAERPRRFRLRATTALSGPEIDLGSNESRFWLWARRNEPPAVYTADHANWAASPVRGQVPIEPAWLIDAIGLATLDPEAPYIGPVPRGDGTLELRTQVDGPAGPQQRVYVIDDRTAVIREQHVYDPSGSLTASVFAEQYRYDAVSGVSLPERVRLNVPAAGLELTIHTGPVTVNAPISGGAQLWSLPQIPGTPVIDLASQGAGPVASAGPWNLTGTPAPDGVPEQLATSFGERASALADSPPPFPRHEDTPRVASPQVPAASFGERLRFLSGASASPRTEPTNPSDGFRQPVATPVAIPAARPTDQQGYSTLPAGGRTLE